MFRTIHEVEDLLHKPEKQFVPWSSARRRAVYGWSATSVRRQLVKVHLLGSDVWVHRKEAGAFIRVNARVRRKEKAKGWGKFNADRIDVFCWRPIRGGRNLSRHAHAIAVDINPRTNPQGAHRTDIPVRVIQAFMDEGFRWGGTYRGTPDVMHFERH